MRPVRPATSPHPAAPRRSRVAPAAAVIGIALALAPLLLARVALGFDLPPSQPGVSVYDFADVWSSDAVASAEQTADRLRSQTGVQMAIVSIPSGQSDVSSSDAQQTAKDVMDAWGVGQAGVNNGIVVLFDLDTSLEHGQIYIYGGSGIIGRYLSIGATQNIVNDMLDNAQSGDLDGALTVGMSEIADAVDSPGSRLEDASPLRWPVYATVAADAVFLVFMIGLWFAFGRDPAMPEIDDSVLLPTPPPGLTPSMAALLSEGEVSRNAMAAALVDLASRNLLSMREGDGSGGAIDYVLADPADPKVVDADRAIGNPERLVLHTLRRIATNRVVKHDDLRKAAGLRDGFAKAMGRAAVASGWFRSDPTRAINRFGALLLVPFGAFLAPLIVWGLQHEGMLDGPSTLVAMAVTVAAVIAGALINQRMAVRTSEGSSALAMTLAYRNTLRHEIGAAPGVVTAQATAKLKMPWLETPDALIVWAVALGLAKEVGDLVTHSGDDPVSAAWHPAWYAGSAAAFASFGTSISSITVTAGSAGGGYGGGVSVGGGGAGGGF
jgi:uncharacterized membrane protein YgcG